MRHAGTRSRSRGFTYLGLLFAVTLLGFALATAGTLWSVAARRDREARLLWVGAQYQRAIASYYRSGPAGARQLPPSLEDLLEDHRGPTLQRHLRRLYPDPMTNRNDWTIERSAEGRITGVRSSAQGKPMMQAGFAPESSALEGAECYCDWSFVFVPHLGVPTQEKQ